MRGVRGKAGPQGSIVRSLTSHFCKRLFPRLEPMTSWSHGKQLAALHALANIVGETRAENDVLVDGDAEQSLRRLIYETTSKTSKLTPSGYRVISGLVMRAWWLMEVISRREIIDIVTDAFTETEKIVTKLEEAIRRGPYLGRKLSEAQPAVMTEQSF